MFTVESLPKARIISTSYCRAGFHFFSVDVDKFIHGEVVKNVKEFLSQGEVRKCSGIEFENNMFNYDFDSANFIWCCNRTKELDSVEFMISLYYDSNLDLSEPRIILQCHRLKGNHSLFLSIIQSFLAFKSAILTPLKTKTERPYLSKSFSERLPPGYPQTDMEIKLKQSLSACHSFIHWIKSDPLESLQAFSTTLPSFSSTLQEILSTNDMDISVNKDGNIEKYLQAFALLYEDIIKMALDSWRALNRCTSPTTVEESSREFGLSHIDQKSPQSNAKSVLSFESKWSPSIISIQKQQHPSEPKQCPTRFDGFPKEYLSRVLFLSLACIFLPFNQNSGHGLDCSQLFLKKILQKYHDFIQLIECINNDHQIDIIGTENVCHSPKRKGEEKNDEKPDKRRRRSNSFDAFNAQEIAMYADLLDKQLSGSFVACH